MTKTSRSRSEEGRQRRQRGAEFQGELEEALRRLPSAWVRRLRDSHNDNPFDYLVLTPDINVGIEAKRVKGVRFHLSALRPSQVQGLIEFERALPRNYGVVAIRFDREPASLVIVPIMQLLARMRDARTLTLHRNDLLFQRYQVPGEPGAWSIDEAWPFGEV